MSLSAYLMLTIAVLVVMVIVGSYLSWRAVRSLEERIDRLEAELGVTGSTIIPPQGGSGTAPAGTGRPTARKNRTMWD